MLESDAREQLPNFELGLLRLLGDVA